METFAEYILGEKDYDKKLGIMYFMGKKADIFFDGSVVFKTELAKLFIEQKKLDVDENLVLTACLLCACKKSDNPHCALPSLGSHTIRNNNRGSARMVLRPTRFAHAFHSEYPKGSAERSLSIRYRQWPSACYQPDLPAPDNRTYSHTASLHVPLPFQKISEHLEAFL